jgi:hypothetical protein
MRVSFPLSSEPQALAFSDASPPNSSRYESDYPNTMPNTYPTQPIEGVREVEVFVQPEGFDLDEPFYDELTGMAERGNSAARRTLESEPPQSDGTRVPSILYPDDE